MKNLSIVIALTFIIVLLTVSLIATYVFSAVVSSLPLLPQAINSFDTDTKDILLFFNNSAVSAFHIISYFLALMSQT